MIQAQVDLVEEKQDKLESAELLKWNTHKAEVDAAVAELKKLLNDNATPISIDTVDPNLDS